MSCFRKNKDQSNKDCWNIEDLRDDAEEETKRWRQRAVVTAILACGPLLIAAIAPWFVVIEDSNLAWIIAKLSVLLILAAFLMLVTRILLNQSNVWLGRAGTLEDLGMALKLIGKSPTGETPLYNIDDTHRLEAVVISLERRRRVFENELLKGPKLEVPTVFRGSS